MFKKICSFLLLICLFFTIFTGVQQVFAESDPPTVDITSPVFEPYLSAGYNSFYYNQAISATADVRDSGGNPVTENIRWYYRIIDNAANPIVELGTHGNQITFNPAAINNGLILNPGDAYCIYLNAEYTDPVTNLTATAPAQGSDISGRMITISSFLNASIDHTQSNEGETVQVTGYIQTNGFVPEGTQASIALYKSDKTALRNVDNSKIQASGTVSNGNATVTLQIPTQYRLKKNSADLPVVAGDYLIRLNIGDSIRFIPYEIIAAAQVGGSLLHIDKTEVVKGTTVTASVYDAVYAGQTVSVALWDDGEVVYSFKEQSDVFVDVLLDEQGRGQETVLIPSDVPAGDYGFRIFIFSEDDYELLDPGVTLKVIEPEINKQTLQTAISAAAVNKASTAVSMDGSEIEPANQWVSQGRMTAYETAIATAQGIYDKADATQMEVDQAAVSLVAATDSFNAAKKAGTKQIIYQVTFSSAGNGTLAATVDGSAISSGNTVAAGKNVVFTASPAENYRVKQWTVGGTPVAGNRTNTLTLANLQAAKVVTVDFGEALNIDHTVSREVIVSALEKATDKLIEKFDDSGFNYQQHWMAIAIKGFNKSVPTSYLNAIRAGDMPAANSGQYGKYILGILAAGGDPTDINGRNLLAELCQLSDMRNVNEEGGIYTTPFGLLALDAVNYEIPTGAGFTRDDLINKLIPLAIPTGGEDGVGFVLTALSKYYNEKPAVKAAVDNVISAWANRQGEDGGFGAGAWSTENNVNTAAQVLMGVSFNGKDPQSGQFTKSEGNLVSFILSLQNEDGTFNWQREDPGSISMATEQAVYALAQYLRQLDGRKSIYDFTPAAADETAPVISTDLENKTVNASGFTFTVSASDAADGTVEPVVKADGKQVPGTAGIYRIALNKGANAITITAADLSGNRTEKSFTIVYVPKTQDIPAGNQPRVDIPADNDDYRIEIPSNQADKEITIKIPEGKASVVTVDLPSNSSLPRIEAVKGDVAVLIPKGTQVKGGNSSGIELITSVNGSDNVLKNKVKEIIPGGKELGSVVQAFSMGSGEAIEFSDFIVLTFKGMHGKEAAYIQNGTVHAIQRYASDSGGSGSGKNEYVYDSGNDLIVKTKHFTDFIAYTVSTAETPDDGEDTQPQPAKYVTLSVDKLTIREGYVIPPTQVELHTGDTAWTLLKRELDKRGISCKYIWTAAYGSVYVQSIDGDGEFDHGSGSGWMYAVNGWYPNYGATKYILKDGDEMQWRYTTNLGADLGEDLSKWENTEGATPSESLTPVISPDDKTPVIEIPKDIQKDYTLNIKKEHTNTENITISIPEVKAKVILNLEDVKGDLPKITAVRSTASLIIDKGTVIKTGSSNIEVLTAIDTNDVKLLELIKGSINNNEMHEKVSNAFVMGNTNNPVLLDRPVTLIFKDAKGQHAGFIEDSKFTPVEIYETEEIGALATRDSEKKTYAFVKDNDLYIRTNHFTTFVSYTESNVDQVNTIDLKKVYKDESAISAWAYEAIGAATQNGFVTGNNGRFNPRDSITRAEFTKLIVSVLGLDIKADKAINFTDVRESNWFYPYVNAAYKAGIVKGSGSRFNPGEKITREQMAAIVVRALGIQPMKPVTAIQDMNTVSDGFKTDVETIFAIGLMVGDGRQFNPGDSATREMAAVVAMKAYDYRNRE